MRAGNFLVTFASRPPIISHLSKHMSANKHVKLSSMAHSHQSTGSAIVRFYDPDVRAKDTRGRTQEQILAWDDSHLEHSHNYIQVLFPLPEGSPFNWSAPVIDLETMRAFRTRSELRQQLGRSFERMLTFYGFTASTSAEPENEKAEDIESQKQTSAEPAKEGTQDTETSTTATPTVEAVPPQSTIQASPPGYLVVRGDNWRRASRNWCVRFDHNHLRITRILRCLRVLGLQKESDAFFAALKRVYEDPAVSIGARSLDFWTRAAERPLYLPPDDMEDECEWLKVWEKEQRKEK
ncbi:opioid growth factor receptor conserved region-domain-containing protein [Boeremia exigua]|uniref:opioid growth factor receptor conserved region-domain-containing protein n=1 Tax=Boeremia exigua TaxID=749465 RepID=UPI001E8DFC0A|nr:opioid growth factor receptor conserved region-domain-containing protein [Boeremia exigua]KAH6644619.1 opioid growth factor receptor conserved region-domain-containing protein [Boeremia exigua]